jgi:hypothetical protein
VLKLTQSQIITLATMVAEDVGITINRSAIRIILTASPSMPAIFRSDAVQLWVDRYYIAYSYEDEIPVHYVFINEKHAREELVGVTARLSHSCIKLEQLFLTDIQRQLRLALLEAKTDYVREDYWNRMKGSDRLAI